MDKTTKTALKNKVTASRLLLEKNVIDRLQGYYGIHQSGLIEDSKILTHLATEDQEYRRQLLVYLDHIQAFGLKPKDALEHLVREIAFTHLNRLCAYKLMERRGFIRESVSKGTKSQGFLFYLADNPEDEALAKSGDIEKAYRHFLRWLSGTFRDELGALFSDEDSANRLYPPQRVLDQVLELLNADELGDIWTEDETIGWVYQYFTPKELRDKSHKENRSPKSSYEMAFRNQFYTPRYVVEFLTDNTLGRTWYEMRQGKTNLAMTCQYLVHRPTEVWLSEGKEAPERGAISEQSKEGLLSEPVYIPFRPLKDPRQLKILDPACGSGHFLLYCFDVLQVIYAEAWDDCPQLFSDLRGEVSREEFLRQVPGMILRYNLHGIDIDLRATQIASLALWLRAQRAFQQLGLKRDQRPLITRANIVSAEPMPGEEELLQEFTQTIQPPVIGQLVRAVFNKMKLAGEAGSLLSIEEDLQEAVEAAKKQWLARPKAEQLALWSENQKPKPSQPSLFDTSGISDAEFWTQAETRTLEALQVYAGKTQANGGLRKKLFSEDTERGFSFIELARKRFDVVLMNPPFGETSQASKAYVEKTYPRSKGDILANFVEKALKWCTWNGMVGAITSRTPFYLGTMANFREKVLQHDGCLTLMADLGDGVLEAMVETAAYVISRKPIPAPASFIRCLLSQEKTQLIQKALESIRQGRPNDLVFVNDPDDFARLPGSPYCYWVSEETIKTLSQRPSLEGNLGSVRVGLQTGDDWRFLRLFWEVPAALVNSASNDWVPFSKTDFASPWYSPIFLVVYWKNNGEVIKNFTDEKGKLRSRPQNLDYYFKPGFSYMLRSTRLVPYVVPSGVIPTAGRAQVYPNPQEEFAVLGYCASNVASAVARFSGEKFAWPKFQASMVQNLPVPSFPRPLVDAISNKITQELKVRRDVAKLYEPFQEFSYPVVLAKQPAGSSDWNLLSLLGEDLDEEIAAAFGLNDDQLQELERDIREAVAIRSKKSEDLEDAVDDSEEEPDDEANIQFVDDRPATRYEELISYLVGCAFGRWDVRIGMDPELAPLLPGVFDPIPACPPASLVNPQGSFATSGTIVSDYWLRARPDANSLPEMVGDQVVGNDGKLRPGTITDSDYPLNVAWDGILVDDMKHPSDITIRAHAVLDLLYSGQYDSVEQEACQALSVSSLSEYFSKSGSGGFWMDHIRRYSKSRRKAPIYWLLQSSRKNYALWLYYHRLDKDMLFKALTQYVEPKIRLEEEHLKTLRAQRGQFGTVGKQAKELDQAMERQTDLLVELEDFRDKLRRAANLGLEPDLNDGVVLNIAPLWELVPWNEAKKYWQELLDGKYEWSSIGKQLRAKGLVK